MNRILNIGCGNDTYGTDFVDIFAKRKEVLTYNADTDKLPYEDNTFDEVYSTNMMEHLTNPAHFMREAMRVLKPEGKLRIRTDNSKYIGIVFPIGGVYNHKYDISKDDRHYMIFTPIHMKHWAEKFDLKDINIYYSCVIGNTDGKIKRAIKKLMHILIPKEYSAVHIWLEAKKKND